MAHKDLVWLAEEYCAHYHEGQRRKSGNQPPYATHPDAVRRILVRYGYDDPETQAIALLHDTIEDTRLNENKSEIEKRFGPTIYEGVYVLSRNTIGKHGEQLAPLFEAAGIRLLDGSKLTPEAYRIRILFSRNTIKRVKIADVIHNTRSLPDLSRTGIEKKLHDAEAFYIPLGRAVAPLMVRELERNIDEYRRSAHFRKLFAPVRTA